MLSLFYLFTNCEAVPLAGSFRYQSHLQGATCDRAHLPKSLLMPGTPTCPEYPLRTGCPVATQGGLPSAPSRYQTLSLSAEGPADIADPLPPAGAAHSGLPRGQDLSLHCGAPGPVSPQAKDRCPLCPLGVQPCLSALCPSPQGFHGGSGCTAHFWPGLGWAGPWPAAL